jgi:hypothetical protein
MQAWKELRIRWMYWRYRYITRNRQRLMARWWRLRSPGRRPTYEPVYRARGQAAWVSTRRGGRTWLILAVTVVAISIFQHYAHQRGLSTDITFLVDVAILILAYMVWRQVAR